MLFANHNFFGGHRFRSRRRRRGRRAVKRRSKQGALLQANYSPSRTKVLTTDWEDFLGTESSYIATRDGTQGLSVESTASCHESTVSLHQRVCVGTSEDQFHICCPFSNSGIKHGNARTWHPDVQVRDVDLRNKSFQNPWICSYEDEAIHPLGVPVAIPRYMTGMGLNIHLQSNHQSVLNSNCAEIQSLRHPFQHPLPPFLAPRMIYSRDVGGSAFRRSNVDARYNLGKINTKSEVCSCASAQKSRSSDSLVEEEEGSVEGETSMWDYDKSLSPRKRKIRVPRSILVCSLCRSTRLKRRVSFAEEELARYHWYEVDDDCTLHK